LRTALQLPALDEGVDHLHNLPPLSGVKPLDLLQTPFQPRIPRFGDALHRCLPQQLIRGNA